ncbi:MAG: sugar phosphate isomerase/epimerase [Flavobacterium sp.]|uniref:sugar phosphate isomerase/epimerase n=1 Tax=Flavobacterium sp. TaxID=239 RepID=UPI0012243667|nr:sugar phosphate isomerase/epimerase [Flavobacterium sp.]RZJ67049.1 MAG: sugar phosphate isomerase/epimerase [Flavobacterium sp.]
MKTIAGEGFSGAEINLASGLFNDIPFRRTLDSLRGGNDFTLIAQQVLETKLESVDGYIERMLDRLHFLSRFAPDFINSHTGKDHYSFDDNCRIIEASEDFAVKSGIPVLHETHRSRFTFHLPTLLPYLEKYPNLKLTADFSHWCNVSETMLDDQHESLAKVFGHVKHIHARVGWEQSAQVNDPFAPEWETHLNIFTDWWKRIVRQQSKNENQITITPEAGPFPYMPQLPYSKTDVGSQWQINLAMKNHLERVFANDLNSPRAV